VGNEKLRRGFSIKVKNEKLPVQYRKKITALASCTNYKFILRAFNSAGCGIPELYDQNIITESTRTYFVHNMLQFWIWIFRK